MKIFFEQIGKSGKSLDLSLKFDVDDISLTIDNFNGKIYPVKKGFFLDGILNLTILDKCDRCLCDFIERFSDRVMVELVPVVKEDDKLQEEEELDEEDVGYYLIHEDYIDLDKILYQEALLMRPLKRLCSNECKGLCSGCGRNLNEEACLCSQHVDERWRALSNLLDKEQKNKGD